MGDQLASSIFYIRIFMQIVKNNKHFVLSLFTWILDSNLKDGDIVKVPHNEQQRRKLESFIRLFVQKEH